MRKKILILLGVIGLFGAIALMVLKAHSLEIVHRVVMHSLVQKARPEQSERIQAVFEESLRRATKSGNEDEYLRQLLSLSQRLEKVQQLETEEVRQILEELSER
jgi:hypothetical protein